MSTPTEHRSVVHGLEVASDLELPELRVDGALVRPRGTQGPDVEIRVRAIPAHPSDPSDRWFHVRPDGTIVVRVEGVAVFAVREGRRIDVEPAPDADAAEVRTYLLGSGIGLLLHQRGELPLHVSAVVLDGRAWAFTAPSGTGKSTLAAALHLHAGLAVLADDVAVARASGDDDEPQPQPLALPQLLDLWPGLPVLKLRDDALSGVDAHGLEARGIEALPEHRGSVKVRLRLDEGPGAPVPLAGLVLLQRGGADDEVHVRRVTGAAAFLTAQSAVYRLPYGGQIAGVPTVFARVARLASRVPCYRAVLPHADVPASAARARQVVEALRDLASVDDVRRDGATSTVTYASVS